MVTFTNMCLSVRHRTSTTLFIYISIGLGRDNTTMECKLKKITPVSIYEEKQTKSQTTYQFYWIISSEFDAAKKAAQS